VWLETCIESFFSGNIFSNYLVKMTKLSVSVNVEEIVVGLEELLGELSDRYMSYAIFGSVCIFLGILFASCIGSMCGLLLHGFCKRRFSQRKRKRKRPSIRRNNTYDEISVKSNKNLLNKQNIDERWCNVFKWNSDQVYNFYGIFWDMHSSFMPKTFCFKLLFTTHYYAWNYEIKT
jgi:hypothetical protein